MTRDGAVRKLVGLITQRSQVQILLPLLSDNADDLPSGYADAHPSKQVSPDDRLLVNTSKLPPVLIRDYVSKLPNPVLIHPGVSPC